MGYADVHRSFTFFNFRASTVLRRCSTWGGPTEPSDGIPATYRQEMLPLRAAETVTKCVILPYVVKIPLLMRLMTEINIISSSPKILSFQFILEDFFFLKRLGQMCIAWRNQNSTIFTFILLFDFFFCPFFFLFLNIGKINGEEKGGKMIIINHPRWIGQEKETNTYEVSNESSAPCVIFPNHKMNRGGYFCTRRETKKNFLKPLLRVFSYFNHFSIYKERRIFFSLKLKPGMSLLSFFFWMLKKGFFSYTRAVVKILLKRGAKKKQNLINRYSVVFSGVSAGGIFQLIRQPVKTFVETVTTGSARGLNVPVTVAQGVQSKLVRDLRSVHGIGQILEKEEKKKRLKQIPSVRSSVKYWCGPNFSTKKYSRAGKI